ncbi:MAG: cytochrome c3 family protein [Nitrospirota bacterium]
MNLLKTHKNSVIILISLIILFTCGDDSIAKFKKVEVNSCVLCHKGLKAKRLRMPVVNWKKSIHKEAGIICSDCHGGDPTLLTRKAMSKDAGFIGKPTRFMIPELCAKCHANADKMGKYNIPTDQYANYKKSVHGRLLSEERDEKAAVCIDCHGRHDIKKVTDRNSPVYRLNLPDTCGKCHSSKEIMDGYDIPTDQVKLFKEGVHGKIIYGKLSDKNPLAAPNCTTCHGKHGERSLSPIDIPGVCGHCHSVVLENFKKSVHFSMLQQIGIPTCITCHGNHKNIPPTPDKFIGDKERDCGVCHDSSSIQYQVATLIKKNIDEAKAILEEAKNGIEELKDAGRNITDLNNKYSDAVTHILMIPSASHSLNVETINQHIKEAATISEDILKTVQEFRDELKDRFRDYLIVILMVFVIIFFIFVKLYIIRKKDLSG